MVLEIEPNPWTDKFPISKEKSLLSIGENIIVNIGNESYLGLISDVRQPHINICLVKIPTLNFLRLVLFDDIDFNQSPKVVSLSGNGLLTTHLPKPYGFKDMTLKIIYKKEVGEKVNLGDKIPVKISGRIVYGTVEGIGFTFIDVKQFLVAVPHRLFMRWIPEKIINDNRKELKKINERRKQRRSHARL